MAEVEDVCEEPGVGRIGDDRSRNEIDSNSHLSIYNNLHGLDMGAKRGRPNKKLSNIYNPFDFMLNARMRKLGYRKTRGKGPIKLLNSHVMQVIGGKNVGLQVLTKTLEEGTLEL